LASSIVLAIAARTATAQAVRVLAIEAETRRPVVGAIVVLRDSANAAVSRGLTNEAGRLVLPSQRPGTFWLRADRIGHAGVSTEPFQVSDTVSQTIVMPQSRLELPDLTSESVTQCTARPEGESVARLWEEIRKGLVASELTAESRTVELAVRTFRRYRTPTGVLRRDSTKENVIARGWTYVSPEPALLHSAGFIREQDGDFQFFAPDARVLLSDRFLESHCLELARADARQPDLVGMAFRPVPGRNLPEIRGVLWVDRATAELRHLEFWYLNVPRPVRVEGLGGRIGFRRLPTGPWVVSDWHIRMPERARLATRWSRLTRDTVLGYIDDGAVVRLADDVAGAITDPGNRASELTTVLGTITGRVVSAEGRPIRQATIAASPGGASDDSDLAGAFSLDSLPTGTVRIRVNAIGFRPLGASVRLSTERRAIDTVFVLEPLAQTLAPLEVRAAPDRPIGKLIDFERRRKLGFGSFLTRAELVPWEPFPLSTALRTLRGAVLVPRRSDCGGGFAAASTRDARAGACLVAPACPFAIYQDGVRIFEPGGGGAVPNIDDYLTMRVEAIEVYRGAGEAPIEYQGTGAFCGVIVIWTRITSP
jgi:hypothetical protein